MNDNKESLVLPPHATLCQAPHELPMEIVEDLIYYDGPVLSHVKDTSGNGFLYLWVDGDDKSIRWMVISVNDLLMVDYKANKLSLLDLIGTNEILYFVDADGFDIHQSFSIELNNIDPSLLPLKDSYFDPSMAKSYDIH